MIVWPHLREVLLSYRWIFPQAHSNDVVVCVSPEVPKAVLMRSTLGRLVLSLNWIYCGPVQAALLGACQGCCCPAGGCLPLVLRDELHGKVKPLIDCLVADIRNT